MPNQKISSPSNILIIKSLIIICVLLILLNAIILYTKGSNYYKYCSRSMIVEMKTYADGHSSVYFDTGSSYSESECYTFETQSTSDFRKYRIPLPVAPIRAIRFDPLNAEGIFEVKSVAVETIDGQWSWADEKLAQQIVPLQQINTVSTSPYFKGLSTGEDPNFHVEGLTIPANRFFLSPLLLLFIKSTAGIALMGSIVFFMINALTHSDLSGRIKIKIVSYLTKSICCSGTVAITAFRESYGSIQIWKRHGDLKWAGYAGLGMLVILLGREVWNIYLETGLFRWIGTDFAHYYVQSIALWSGDPSAIYKPEVYDVTFQKLLKLHSPNHLTTYVSHIPYPPLFAWLFTPFTIASPFIGFVLWGMVNLIALIHLAWRVSQLFPNMKLSWAMFVLLASFPVTYCLIVGQPQILYACAVAECYLSLRKGRDFQAGLWLAFLFFKPQYGILLGLLLIWKCRWAAVAGAVIGGLVVIEGSVLAAGMETLMLYPTTLTDMKEFFTLDANHMINWRSLVLWLGLGIGEIKAMMLTYDLALITIFITAIAWRGAWLLGDPRFPARFTLVLLATILCNHHSFNYGAVMLVLPLAAALAEGQRDRLIQLSVIACIILPTLAFTLVGLHNVPLASLTLTLSLLALYVSLLRWLWQYVHSTAKDQNPLILDKRQLEGNDRIY
jgi:hypothetical protein